MFYNLDTYQGLVLQAENVLLEADALRMLERADRIHRFPAKMAIKLAHRFLGTELPKQRSESIAGATFYDPFCGSGTTALAARYHGCKVGGGELHPNNALIAMAKLNRLREDQRSEATTAIQHIELTHGGNPEEFQFWDTWYSPTALTALQEIREAILEYADEPYYVHLAAALSQTCWDASKADGDVMVPTHSSRTADKRSPSSQGVLAKFEARFERILKAQTALDALKIPHERVKVQEASATDSAKWPANIDVILTSPPYGLGIDYNRAASLQARVMMPFHDFAVQRNQMIGRRANVEADHHAIPARFRTQDWYLKLKAAADDRHEAFCQYLADMRLVIQVAHNKLSSTGIMGLVVGDPEMGRSPVPLTDILEQFARDTGFQVKARVADTIRQRYQTAKRRSSERPISEENLLVLV